MAQQSKRAFKSLATETGCRSTACPTSDWATMRRLTSSSSRLPNQ